MDGVRQRCEGDDDVLEGGGGAWWVGGQPILNGLENKHLPVSGEPCKLFIGWQIHQLLAKLGGWSCHVLVVEGVHGG
jgi:hypothetical protein